MSSDGSRDNPSEEFRSGHRMTKSSQSRRDEPERPRPPNEPTPPAQGTLTRLIGQRAVRYFLAGILISTFFVVFTLVEGLFSGLICLPDTLGAATSIAQAASGSSQSATEMMKAHYISCTVSTALHPLVIFLSLLVSTFASLPVYSLLQSIEQGELLRTVI